MAVIAANEDLQTPPYAVRYESTDPISNIQTEGKTSYETYRMRIGETCYVDDDFIISRCPAMLTALPAIKTGNRADNEGTSEGFLSFDLLVPARVYVAYDPMVSHKPEWLRPFQDEEAPIEILEEWRGERALYLYSKEFEPGTVVLGGNKAYGFQAGYPVLNYIVIVQVLI